jgi:3-methyladenine DNA glycosylase AlkD
MELKQVLAKLEAAGSEQTRTTYRRHGIVNACYGVSYAELGKLVKLIKVDQALAEGLWKCGIHDAKILATMVADPAAISEKTLDAWCGSLDNAVVADAFAKLASQSPFAKGRAAAWAASRDELTGTAGWVLVNCLAMGQPEIPDAFFAKYVKEAEATIHGSKNRVRYSMITALIGIGLRGEALERQVLTAVKAIGPVEIDMGDTDCKVPDVAAYIAKTKAYRAGRAAGSPRLGRPKVKKTARA